MLSFYVSLLLILIDSFSVFLSPCKTASFFGFIPVTTVSSDSEVKKLSSRPVIASSDRSKSNSTLPPLVVCHFSLRSWRHTEYRSPHQCSKMSVCKFGLPIELVSLHDCLLLKQKESQQQPIGARMFWLFEIVVISCWWYYSFIIVVIINNCM